MPDLKHLSPAQVVKAIRHCRDTYRVSTLAGEEIAFWEFNLRFKTDTSPAGPQKGLPVLMPSGMRGDRAQVVFSSPGEISQAIKEDCGA
jgi:cytochrome c